MIFPSFFVQWFLILFAATFSLLCMKGEGRDFIGFSCVLRQNCFFVLKSTLIVTSFRSIVFFFPFIYLFTSSSSIYLYRLLSSFIFFICEIRVIFLLSRSFLFLFRRVRVSSIFSNYMFNFFFFLLIYF